MGARLAERMALSQRFMTEHSLVAAIVILFIGLTAILVLAGCSVNGHPMRFNPSSPTSAPKARSWFIEGKATNNAAVSCSFVEFDERGDFLDFDQHLDCEARMKEPRSALYSNAHRIDG